MPTFYGYAKCSTCRKARQHLAARGVQVQEIDITASPPPKSLLQAVLKTGKYKLGELFNRSGELYRQLKIKDKIKTTPESQLIDLLAKHGKLVKRPIVTDGRKHTVGFDPETFDHTWV